MSCRCHSSYFPLTTPSLCCCLCKGLETRSGVTPPRPARHPRVLVNVTHRYPLCCGARMPLASVAEVMMGWRTRTPWPFCGLCWLEHKSRLDFQGALWRLAGGGVSGLPQGSAHWKVPANPQLPTQLSLTHVLSAPGGDSDKPHSPLSWVWILPGYKSARHPRLCHTQQVLTRLSTPVAQ